MAKHIVYMVLFIVLFGLPPTSRAGSVPPLVSITFDDAYRDPLDREFIAYLEAHSYRATFYIPTARINATGYFSDADLRALAIRGHEITAHTRTHVDLTQQTQQQLTDEIVGSRDDLIGLGLSPGTFAYPFGASNQTMRDAVESAGFIVSRGTDTALNYQSTDRFNLQADSQKETTEFMRTASWIDNAIATNGWYILLFHKIDRPSDPYSISSAKAKQIVDYLAQKKISVVTVREGACIYFAIGCETVIR